MSAVESRLYKIMGGQVELFQFFQSRNPVEHIGIPRIIAFKVTFFEKPFPYQRNLTYEYKDAYNTLLPIL